MINVILLTRHIVLKELIYLPIVYLKADWFLSFPLLDLYFQIINLKVFFQ